MWRPGFRALALLLFLVGGPTAARADFCEDLNVVLASAKDGFSAVRGELVSKHLDPLGDSRVVWQCTLALTGTKTCEVEWRLQAFTYNTYWHKQDEEANAETFEALTELLTGCGLAKKETSKSGRSIWYVIENEENLDAILAYTARRVRLSFTTAGFPNP